MVKVNDDDVVHMAPQHEDAGHTVEWRRHLRRSLKKKVAKAQVQAMLHREAALLASAR